MATLTLSARLDRTDANTPWGFRMQGGRDYGSPLVITRVTPGSLAAKCGLQVGDAITKIGDSPTDVLVHKDAQHRIVTSGNSLELALQRGGSGGGLSRPVQPPAPAPAPSYGAGGASYGGAPAPAAYSTPPSQSQKPMPPFKPTIFKNYNTAAKPFAPGSVPVAVNKQYNTPIDMYSVNNVIDSLATQTAGVNIGQPGTSESEHGVPSGGVSQNDDTSSTSSFDTNSPPPHAPTHLGNAKISTPQSTTLGTPLGSNQGTHFGTSENTNFGTPKGTNFGTNLGNTVSTPRDIAKDFTKLPDTPVPWAKTKPVIGSKPFGNKPVGMSTNTGVASTGVTPSPGVVPKVVAPTGVTPTQSAVQNVSGEEDTPRIRGYHQEPAKQSRSFRLLKTLIASEEDVPPSTNHSTPLPPVVATQSPPPIPSQLPPPVPSQPPPPPPVPSQLPPPVPSQFPPLPCQLPPPPCQLPPPVPSQPPPPVPSQSPHPVPSQSPVPIQPPRVSPPREESKFSDTPKGNYVKAIVNKQYNTPMGLYSTTNKQDTFATQSNQILATIPGVDVEVMHEPAERKKIVIPSPTPPSYHQNTVRESPERKQITISPSSYGNRADTVQEPAERKKIVLPKPMFNAKQPNDSKPYGSQEKLDDDSNTKPYVASETMKLVQDLDKVGDSGKSSPFGQPAHVQSRSFNMLQKHLDDPSGPPRGGAGAPYKPPGQAAPKAPWQPTIPTGERKMKIGKAGEATRMSSAAGRIPICTNCGIQIRGPFVSALDKTWCPDHFVCANPECRVPLIDQGFVEEAGQLFCVRDYEQYFAPRCHKCGSAIIGERIAAVDKTYHPHCFICCHCRQPITGGKFHREEEDLYCDKDWAALFQTKCYGCQFPIEPGDRWVEALNQNWHSECFNCSTCQVNLEGQSFFAKAGKPYCKKHAGGPRF